MSHLLPDHGPAAAERRATAFWMLVVSAPLIVAVLWVLWVVRFDPWVAHNDFAVMRVSLERMLDGHVPTVGTYSRLGVYHPGPLREWLFVVPYALGGGRAATLPATALLVNLGWLMVCGWLSVRAGAGACRVAICAGATLLVIGIGPNLASPWNPHLAIIPLYVACWAVALLISRRERDVSVALAAVAAASFAGQMHASALPAAGLLLCTAIVVPVARRWGSLNRWCVMPLVLAVVLWIGVLIDLRNLGNSNLVDLVQAGSGSTLGLSSGSGLTSRLLWPQTVLVGESIRPSAASMIGFSRFWVIAVVVTLCGSALSSWSWWQWSWWPRRRRERQPADVATLGAAALVALIMVVTATATIAAFEPPPYRYLFGPLQAVGVFALTVLLCWPLRLIVELAADDRLLALASIVALPGAALVWAAMFVAVPVDDHESAERRALGVDAAVEQLLVAHPAWSAIEVVGLDMRGALLEDEVAVIAYRAGREVRMRQFGLDLPTPQGDEPVIAVAMGQAFECLDVAASGAIVLRGAIGSEAVGIFALEPAAEALDRCGVR